MKKMLFWAILSLIYVNTFAAQQVISACYTVGPGGKIGLKIVSPSGSLSGLHVWLNDGSSTYDPGTFIWGSVVPDDDGVNWDYSYKTNTTISLADLTNPNFQMPCYIVYYTTGSGTPPNLSAVQACPCQPVTAGCFTDDGHGRYHIKLVFTTAYYNMHMDFTPGITGGPTGYLVEPGLSDPEYDLNNWVPEGDHYAVYYSIPNTYFATDANGCITVRYDGVGIATESDPNTWPSTQSVQVCPCCNPTIVSVTATSGTPSSWLTQSFSTLMLSDWDFGDGSAGYGMNVSHTYAIAGNYLVCASSTEGDGTPCTVCHAFCLTDPHPSGISGGPGSPCDANFSVSVSPFGNIVVTSDIVYMTTTSTATYDYDFGDGSGTVTGTSGYITHTYASSGTYIVCVTVTVTHGTVSVSCNRCMTVCVDVTGPKPGTTTPPEPLQPLAESMVIAPNPAENSASILFDLDKDADVRVMITDALGKVVRDFSNNAMTQGRQHIDINTSGFPTGVYNVSVKTDKATITKRLSVLR